MRDKLDWHVSRAEEAGQPPEHGFVHVACFLHWLARRGWLDDGMFDRRDIRRIAAGTISLEDLIQLTDEQMAADMATSEGQAFGEARYDAYLDRWTQAFSAIADYGVPWTAETRAVAVGILDELLGAWQAEPPAPARPRRGGALGLRGTHVHPEAEHLIPEAVLGLPLEVDSLPPAIMGRTTLDEPLTQAGIDPMRSALS